MPNVLIIRHPETVANAEGRLVGRTDSPWSDRGRDQLRRIKSLVMRFGPSEIWSSPAPRALKAANAAALCHVPLRIVDALCEVDFGLAEGRTFAEAQSLGIPLSYVPSDPPRTRPSAAEHATEGHIAPHGESWDDLIRRTETVARALAASKHAVCVFTHGGIGRALIATLLHLPVRSMWAFALPPAGAAEIVIDGAASTLTRLWSSAESA